MSRLEAGGSKLPKKLQMSPIKNIGIIGGGQLARMLSLSCANLGFYVHIYCPEIDCPAAQVSNSITNGDYTDKNKLRQFSKPLDILTYEFENIDSSGLKAIEKETMIFPSVKSLEISQDRYLEKSFLNDLGVKTTPFYKVETFSDLELLIKQKKRRLLLKTRRFGYDGKGQVLIKNYSDIKRKFPTKLISPSIAEEVLDFDKEISIILARDIKGKMKAFDAAENKHKDGILVSSVVPAKISEKTKKEAVLISKKIALNLNHVGVIGVEFFLKSEKLYVNEIAPRVHNSGHWTMDASNINQFEQHIRAISGLPLLSPERYANVSMYNLIGTLDIKKKFLKNAKHYLYGKNQIRSGRKMGHINVIKKGS